MEKATAKINANSDDGYDFDTQVYSHEDVFRSAEGVLNNYFGTNIKLKI